MGQRKTIGVGVKVFCVIVSGLSFQFVLPGIYGHYGVDSERNWSGFSDDDISSSVVKRTVQNSEDDFTKEENASLSGITGIQRIIVDFNGTFLVPWMNSSSPESNCPLLRNIAVPEKPTKKAEVTTKSPKVNATRTPSSPLPTTKKQKNKSKATTTKPPVLATTETSARLTTSAPVEPKTTTTLPPALTTQGRSVIGPEATTETPPELTTSTPVEPETTTTSPPVVTTQEPPLESEATTQTPPESTTSAPIEPEATTTSAPVVTTQTPQSTPETTTEGPPEPLSTTTLPAQSEVESTTTAPTEPTVLTTQVPLTSLGTTQTTPGPDDESTTPEPEITTTAVPIGPPLPGTTDLTTTVTPITSTDVTTSTAAPSETSTTELPEEESSSEEEMEPGPPGPAGPPGIQGNRGIPGPPGRQGRPGDFLESANSTGTTGKRRRRRRRSTDGTGGSTNYLVYPQPTETEFVYVEVEMETRLCPIGTKVVAAGGPRFSLGVQTMDDDTRNILFTVWNEKSVKVKSVAIGEGVSVKHLAGHGASAIKTINAAPVIWYRFLIRSVKDPKIPNKRILSAWWGFYLGDNTTIARKLLLIATFMVTMPDNCPAGIQTWYSSVANYDPDSGKTTRGAMFSTQSYYSGGKWTDIRNVIHYVQTFQDTHPMTHKCEIMDRGEFFLETGVFKNVTSTFHTPKRYSRGPPVRNSGTSVNGTLQEVDLTI